MLRIAEITDLGMDDYISCIADLKLMWENLPTE